MLALMLAVGAAARAQKPSGPPVEVPRPRADTSLPAPPQPTRADTTVQRVRGDSVRPRPPVPPGQAFLRSLLLPGWGQATLHRDLTAGFFVAFEGVALTMVWKSEWQLRYARERNVFVASHTQERQDWLILLAFNHLFAGAEAFVAAQLYDFPVGLRLETLPSGDRGIGVSIRRR